MTRLSPTERHQRAVAVPCKVCNAEPGRHCHGRFGRPAMQPHTARQKAAKVYVVGERRDLRLSASCDTLEPDPEEDQMTDDPTALRAQRDRAQARLDLLLSELDARNALTADESPFASLLDAIEDQMPEETPEEAAAHWEQSSRMAHHIAAKRGEKLQVLRGELKAVRAQLGGQGNGLAKVSAERDKLRTDLAAAEKRIGELQEELREIYRMARGPMIR